MTIKFFLKIIFFVLLLVSIVFNIMYIRGLAFQKMHKPIELYSIISIHKSYSIKSSSRIEIKFKGKYYSVEVSKGVCTDIENKIIKPKFYYVSEKDYIFYEGWFFPISIVYLTYLFTICIPTIGFIVYKNELNDHYSTM